MQVSNPHVSIEWILHFTEFDNLLLGVDDTQRRADTQSTFDNVDTNNNRVSFGKDGDNLESTWPDSLRRSVLSLRLCNLIVVGRKLVEQVIDNVRCRNISADSSSVSNGKSDL